MSIKIDQAKTGRTDSIKKTNGTDFFNNQFDCQLVADGYYRAQNDYSTSPCPEIATSPVSTPLTRLLTSLTGQGTS